MSDKAGRVAKQVMQLASQLPPGMLGNLIAEENAGDECMVWYVDNDGRRRRACDFRDLQVMAVLGQRFHRLQTLLREGGELTLRLNPDDDTALDEPIMRLTIPHVETVMARATRDVLAEFKALFAARTFLTSGVQPSQVLEVIDTLLQQLATRWPSPSPSE